MGITTKLARMLLDVRQSGVIDPDVLSAIETVPRDAFVPEGLAAHAYEDTALPIACGQTISQPALVAWMCVALEIGKRMKVLEVGTGSGYHTAVLSRICRRVYTIERHRALAKSARARFDALNFHNITSRIGDGGVGWRELAPFERILVTAAAPAPPPALAAQLAIDGVMVMPVGPANGEQVLMRYRLTRDGWRQEELFGVRFVPLVDGAAA